MIKFSCIVTCYNRENLIQRSLTSILSQTFQDLEIIVVDDASTDKSIEKIKAINDARIKIIVHEKNKGQNAAINTGIDASSYDYLAFLDSDDEWLPTYLMEMHNMYKANPTIGFAYANFVDGPKLTLEGEQKYAETLDQGFLSSMITITAKKESVMHIKKFDERYTICQDDDFCFRLAKNFSFKVIDQQLAVIHGSDNSMSNNLLKVAEGWTFLFGNYKNDILSYCGPKTMSKHLINISYQFFRCKEFKKGMYFYFSSLLYFWKRNHSKRFNYKLSEFMNASWLIVRLNLGTIKRYIFKKQ